MVAKLPRSIASIGVLGALLVLVAAAVAPHLAHAHAALHAHRHVLASRAPRRMPALVTVVIRGDVYMIANSADQDELQVAPSYRCVACGY